MIFLNFFLSSGETQNNEQDQRTVKANQQRRYCSIKSRNFTDICVVEGTNSLPHHKSRSNVASSLILRVFLAVLTDFH